MTPFDPIHSSNFLSLNPELSWVEHWPEMILLGLVVLGLSRHQRNSKKRKNLLKNREERKKMSLPLLINTPVTQEFSINTYDISLSGAFLSAEDLKQSMTFTSLIGKRTGIKVGDKIDIKIYLGRFRQIECQARVVRHNLEQGTHPPHGIGIEFIKMSGKNKRLLSELIYKDELAKSA